MSDIRTTSKPIKLTHFAVSDPFWKEKMELVRKEVIPYQWEILNDRIPDAAPSFCMRNFQIAGKLMQEKREKGTSFEEPKYTYRGFEALPEDMDHMEDKFYGFVFQDSDFSKWIEAVAYSLANHPDAELERIADGAIDMVCAAQQDNGYLDTYYIINGMDKIFTNLRDLHELYCLGHLVEGAVAYYEATGKDKLLKAAQRFADFVADSFGYEEGKCKGYPGHEIAEMALLRLYDVTQDEKYLNLSKFFLDERGKQPYYFSEIEEHDNWTNHNYHQSHKPVREQDEAVGHAVRAVYLYSGMTDMARITGDPQMWDACKRLWHSVTRDKLYITGGIGGTHMGESFSYPFDLPNDTAYAETCASIGLMFWARRMLEAETNSEYADVMEQALYNTVLSGMALDGKSFFYVNPLEVLPEACHKDERKFHVKPVRQKWFGCACCPPNLARLISSLPSYAYAENDDTLFVHLYVGGTVEKDVAGEKAVFEITSDYPWKDSVKIRYIGEAPVTMKLALRLPGWTKEHVIRVQNTGSAEYSACEKTRDTEKGYCYIAGIWNPGDEVSLSFPTDIRVLMADPRVRENIGKVALMKGPVAYCAEEVDNTADLHLYEICPQAPMTEGTVTIEGQTFPTIIAKGKKIKTSVGESLYTEYSPAEYEDVEITYIPYYAWANRGENEMSVWMRAH